MPRQMLGIGFGTLDPTFPEEGGGGGEWPPADAVLVSGWNFATGHTDEAHLDGDKWGDVNGDTDGDVLVVVATTTEDFPSPNHLQSWVRDFGDGTGHSKNARWHDGMAGNPLPGLPTDGAQIYYRWYLEVNTTTFPFGDGLYHCIENGNASQNWQMETVLDGFEATADFRFRWNFEGTRPAGLSGRWQCPTLEKGVVYCVELMIERVSATHFLPHTRIWEPPVGGWTGADPDEGTLLYDDVDFTNTSDSGFSMSELVSGDALGFVSLATMNELQMGNNGTSATPTPAVDSDHRLMNMGCVMVRTDDWCGVYRSEEASA